MDLIDKIVRLKKERSAVLLVHNYQRAEVQDIGDFVGDSLGLSRSAAATDARVIVFAGVHFMAETAKILSPAKTVLLPDANAGCPMADMVTLRELRNKKRELGPDIAVVCYVNSSAEIKAESDICCTSANAVNVIAGIPRERKILFVPDRSLGEWAGERVGREIVLWPGYCPTHHRILPEMIDRARAKHPGAVVMVHPECAKPVRDMADFVGSTSQIIENAGKTAAGEFLIGSEIGMLHSLRTRHPGKKFYPVTELADCPNMKLTTLEKILWALEDNVHEVTVDPDVARRARTAIEKMLEVS